MSRDSPRGVALSLLRKSFPWGRVRAAYFDGTSLSAHIPFQGAICSLHLDRMISGNLRVLMIRDHRADGFIFTAQELGIGSRRSLRLISRYV